MIRFAAALAFLLVASLARAQTLPSRPIVFGNGRVTIGGDAAASIAPDDEGYFNYTDYEHSALRLFQVDVTAAVTAGDHFAFLGQIRTENTDTFQPYAAYMRYRPWTDRRFDVQIGRVPPTFGGFARRAYGPDNPLIGYPLAYQYLTSLRPDAVPASADELLAMRGRGWLAHYSVGNQTPARGVPLVSAFSWDTGVQVHASNDLVDATASVTTGTLSNPLVRDDNSGKQVAGRFAVTPIVGLAVGVSAASGEFVSEGAAQSALGPGGGGGFRQDAWGTDVEYSRGYYLLRGEAIFSRWTLPAVRAPYLTDPVTASAAFIEAKYKLQPGLYAAARVDHLGFSEIAGTARTEAWDAPITRVEAGIGYSLQRNLVLKLTVQHDSRPAAGRVHAATLPAAQLQFWF